LEDFLLAPLCPIEKVVLWVDLLYLMVEPETEENVARKFDQSGN